MADEIMHTVLPSSGGNAWGGSALGAGVGGLIGSWLGNGGFGGFGANRGNAAVAGYDTGLISGVSSQLNNISGQINNADRDFLMQTANQNQFMGNLINSTSDAITGAINSSAMSIQNGINQNTLNSIQNNAATNLAVAQGFGGLNAAFNAGVGSLNLNIANQASESRLQAQQLASQQQQCCCSVLRAIEQEGCANRELQREIQTQNIRDQLANAQAENAALKSQLFQPEHLQADLLNSNTEYKRSACKCSG